MNHTDSGKGNEGTKFRSDEFLRTELNLDEEQLAILTKLDGDVIRSYQLLLDKQCEFNFAILEELTSPNPSKTEMDSIANRIGTYQSLLKKQTIKHFRNIKSICNDDQLHLLDNLLQNMMGLGDQCATCNKRDCARRDRITK
jgi:hypothetical protein